MQCMKANNDYGYHMFDKNVCLYLYVVWPTAQTAAPMAPKVINITHTPITRQGVNTQVREIPLLPTDTHTQAIIWQCIYTQRHTWMHATVIPKKLARSAKRT